MTVLPISEKDDNYFPNNGYEGHIHQELVDEYPVARFTKPTVFTKDLKAALTSA